MPAAIRTEADCLQDTLVSWRRHLHRHPELSGAEAETAAFIAERLRACGYSPRTGVGGHGVLAEIGDPARGPWVALRADTDALPIDEQTGCDYASRRPGVMHACGHDAHVAMLLGAAQLLRAREQQLPRPVRLIFQPHEEVFPGGAPGMIAAGALDGVDQIFGIHICSNVPAGMLGTRPGPFMAAVNPLHIVVHGRGGHAAMPQETVDPVVVAAHIVVALQTVVSRALPIHEPAVVSVTKIEGGTADNVIPEKVEMLGTIRSFAAPVRDLACRRVREIAEGVAATFGARAEVHLDPGYPVLVNDERLTTRALDVARAVGFADEALLELEAQGGGEDFSYYGEQVPGVFVFLGARNPEKDCVYAHHHPRFNVDEDALAAGAALHAQFALSAAP